MPHILKVTTTTEKKNINLLKLFLSSYCFKKEERDTIKTNFFLSLTHNLDI